jgi:coproporphyrinogen III oxidase-like Fe-S oxidoreductase
VSHLDSARIASSETPDSKRIAASAIVDEIREVVCRDSRRRSLLVYVHIPFCSSKCTFCNWVAGIPTSQLRSEEATRSQYVTAVRAQIEYYAPRLSELGYVPELVYWGGGTPSILSPEQISAIGDSLRENFDLSGVREYSVESSPETLSEPKLRAFRQVGMSRLSIGVQSFDESELRRAGRAHSAADAETAIRRARAQGCDNLNVDIITGFPKQTSEMLEATLLKTKELTPEHVTAYPYHPAKGTAMARQLARGHLAGLGAAQWAAAQDSAYQALTGSGYAEYMPKYFSTSPNHKFAGESYYFDWGGDYIGFGSGARSVLAYRMIINRRGGLEAYVSSPTMWDEVVRWQAADAASESCHLLLGGHRLDYERFYNRFGFDFQLVLKRMSAFRLVLDRLGAPLVVNSADAYISGPAGGWHGGELLRLGGRVRSALTTR